MPDLTSIGLSPSYQSLSLVDASDSTRHTLSVAGVLAFILPI